MEGDARCEIPRWIVDATLAGASEVEILAGTCQRLTERGLAIVRASIATDLLDPIHDARGVRWTRDGGGVETAFERTAPSGDRDEWVRSPFYFMLQRNETSLRRRLDGSYRRGEFPVLDTLIDGGASDYIAYVRNVREIVQLGGRGGAVGSFATNAPGGYTEAQLELLGRVIPALTLAFVMRTTHRVTQTALSTYLGSDAAERVLAGNIVRGRAETIRAVVWLSDLVGSTRIAEAIGPEGLLALLNDYAEIQVDVIEKNGGHVLKFIGDGILAIFREGDSAQACARALDAAAMLRKRIASLNERRAAASLPVTDTHLALHLGEFLYGNVGSPRRLDFTVLGPAVNEAARIESLCGSLDQPVIVSTAFAEAAGAARARLVSLGRYAMKGVARPQELYTLDPES
jgi:adenylate cyclase